MSVSLRHLRRDETGSMLTEFSIGLTVLLMLLLGVMDCARAIYVQHSLVDASSAAVRYAMVRGSTWAGANCASTTSSNCTATSSNISNYVANSLPVGITTSSLTTTTTWPGTTPTGVACDTTAGNNSPNCVVQVRVAYSFSFLVPFFPRNLLPMASTSAIAIAR